MSHLSYLSMAQTHLHIPSAAAEAVRIFSGTKSGLVMYLLRMTDMNCGEMLSLSYSWRLCRNFMSPSSFLAGPQKSSTFFPEPEGSGIRSGLMPLRIQMASITSFTAVGGLFMDFTTVMSCSGNTSQYRERSNTQNHHIV